MQPHLIGAYVTSEMDYRRERIARAFAGGRAHTRGRRHRRTPRSTRLDIVAPYGDARA